MTAKRTSQRVLLAVIAWLVCLTASSAAAQDTMGRAKELYLSASYDEALAVLERLQFEATGNTATEIAQYRAFCLLALDRTEDARKAIAGIVDMDPFYHPSEVDASPRVRGVFQEVRRPLLPGIVQRMYTEARAAFDRKDPRAAVQFEKVVALLDDPDLKGTAAADLRTLASGFRDLSKAAAAAAVLPAAPVAAVAPSPAQVAAPSPAPLSNPFAAREGDAGVTPPVTLSASLPPWAPSKIADRQRGFKGALEVTIDEAGDVEAVALRQSVHPAYDGDLLKAARSWKFKPAMKGGFPVLYVKVVEVQLQPKK